MTSLMENEGATELHPRVPAAQPSPNPARVERIWFPVGLLPWQIRVRLLRTTVRRTDGVAGHRTPATVRRTPTVVAGRHRTRADNPAPFQSEMTLRGWLWERWRWPKSAPSRILMGFSRGAASRPRFGAVSSGSGRLGPKKGRFRAMWNEGFALPGSTAVRTLTRGLGSGRSRSPGHRERPRESGGNGQPHLARASALVSSANPRAGRGHLLANEDKARHFLPE